MPTLKILLGEVSTGWRRVLRELAQDDDRLQLVGEAAGPVEILLQTKRISADVVVLSQTVGGGEPGICSHLLLEYPNLVVVLVPIDSGPHILYRLVLLREIAEASKDALHAMLRKHFTD
jgi:hypothetical protein